MTPIHRSPKLLLIHLPGADLQFVHPLVDAGHMPHLAGLIGRGNLGILRATPLLRYPSSTVTLATGRRSDSHGVLGPVTSDPASPAGIRATQSTDVTAHTLWDILDQRGARTATVGWPVSHPAPTSSRSLVVTDTFAEAVGTSFEDWSLDPQTISDPAMHDMFEDLRLHPNEVGPEMILPFIKDAQTIDIETDERIDHLRISLARTMTLHGAATWIADHHDCELLAINFDFVERLTSLFLPYRAPRMGHVTKADFARYNDVVDGAYRMFDMMLGVYLRLMDDDAHVLIASAHGFIAPEARRAPKRGDRNKVTQLFGTHGMLAGQGPKIKPDSLSFGATSLDVVPTMLALLDHPLPSDLDGHSLQGAFDLDPAKLLHESVIVAVRPVIRDPAQDARRIREWAMLGYIDAPPNDRDLAAERQSINDLLALAETLMVRADFGAALAALHTVLKLAPDNRNAQFRVVQCTLSLGQLDACEAAIQDLKDGGVASATLTYFEGHLALSRGDQDQSDIHFAAVEDGIGDAPDKLHLLDMIAEAHLVAKHWEKAEIMFRRVLVRDPGSARANNGLAQACLAQRSYADAEAALRASLSAFQSQPEAHARLGFALTEQGLYNAAQIAFDTASELDPNLTYAKDGRRRLAKMIANSSIGLMNGGSSQ